MLEKLEIEGVNLVNRNKGTTYQIEDSAGYSRQIILDNNLFRIDSFVVTRKDDDELFYLEGKIKRAYIVTLYNVYEFNDTRTKDIFNTISISSTAELSNSGGIGYLYPMPTSFWNLLVLAGYIQFPEYSRENLERASLSDLVKTVEQELKIIANKFYLT